MGTTYGRPHDAPPTAKLYYLASGADLTWQEFADAADAQDRVSKLELCDASLHPEKARADGVTRLPALVCTHAGARTVFYGATLMGELRAWEAALAGDRAP